MIGDLVRISAETKILIPGGAGLVGQNLVTRLLGRGYKNIVVIDKHRLNLNVLKKLHPEVVAVYADLAEIGEWERHIIGANVVVMLQAHIGGNTYEDFVRNNINSTINIINQIKKNSTPYLVHVSSSVVESSANDYYTNTKKEQERIVLESGIMCPVLRPTLMYGWFDRKHLGWLSRFMAKAPVFPIPGNGRYIRQPLYVGDFCNIIISCMENKIQNGIYNISGHERIEYIDIIRKIKSVTKSRSAIVKIPYRVFYALLWTWGLFDRNPPFTTQQLSALVAKDEFEVIDWPEIFGVPYTKFSNAIEETLTHPVYSNVILEF